MMSAEDALQNWTPELCRELQALPQVGVGKAAWNRERDERHIPWGLKPDRPALEKTQKPEPPKEPPTQEAGLTPPAKRAKLGSSHDKAESSKPAMLPQAAAQKDKGETSMLATKSEADSAKYESGKGGNDHSAAAQGERPIQPIAPQQRSMEFPQSSQAPVSAPKQELLPTSSSLLPKFLQSPHSSPQPKPLNPPTSVLAKAIVPKSTALQSGKASTPILDPATQTVVVPVATQRPSKQPSGDQPVAMDPGAAAASGRNGSASPNPMPGLSPQHKPAMPSGSLKIPKEWLARMQSPKL